MVRLLPFGSPSPLLQFRKFQSHYGAIATVLPEKRSFSASSVSIPLWCDCYQEYRPPHCWSGDVSIPLWCDCYPPYPFHDFPQLFSFNPTMVRLLQWSKYRWGAQLDMFQSHYGAIATSRTNSPRWRRRRRFNPTMVRLLLFLAGRGVCFRFLFQSHYGAIATWRGRSGLKV